MTQKREKLSSASVAKICEQIFSSPVHHITAPGGKSRESLRVHFATRSIIATQRAYAGRMRLEVEVLQRLNAENAPVPKFLGGTEQIFFQEDVGSERLSEALETSDESDKLELAERALTSLLDIHEAGKRSGLTDLVPALGAKPEWVSAMIGTVTSTSGLYDIPAPALDMEALVDILSVPPKQFLKWDARPGNASVGADGKVYWFDWEHCGKRHGAEDFAWLAGDEFWPLGPEIVIPLLADLFPKDLAQAKIDYLAHFITFHIVQRLTLIHRRFTSLGWVDADQARRYDKIGVDPDLARQLCKHGEGWADHTRLTRPMVKWFEDCEAAIERLRAWKPTPPSR